jgi:hypothetical protein
MRMAKLRVCAEVRRFSLKQSSSLFCFWIERQHSVESARACLQNEPAGCLRGDAVAHILQTLRTPHPVDSLSWLSWIVARLGGWNCYGRPPGSNGTIRAGWTQFAAMAGRVLHRTGCPYTSLNCVHIVAPRGRC